MSEPLFIEVMGAFLFVAVSVIGIAIVAAWMRKRSTERSSQTYTTRIEELDASRAREKGPLGSRRSEWNNTNGRR